MRLGIIYFTEAGSEIAGKILEKADAFLWEITLRDGRRASGTENIGTIQDWVGELFAEKSALVVIGACGIAVRMTASFVKDKLTDSPVIVADDTGKFVIPLLSGHVGGANELGRQIAGVLGAIPVITTATDNHNLFAVDVFARRNDLCIKNRQGIAAVSGKLLRGERVTIAINQTSDAAAADVSEGAKKADCGAMPQELAEYAPQSPAPPDILVAGIEGWQAMGGRKPLIWLQPKEYVLGIGCRRGKTKEELEQFVKAKCELWEINMEEICAVVSIDVKRNEPGLAAFAAGCGLPLVTYSAQELLAVPGTFSASSFVESRVGVDNVCERAVMAYCGEEGSLIQAKAAENGMTLAAGRRPWKLKTWQ